MIGSNCQVLDNPYYNDPMQEFHYMENLPKQIRDALNYAPFEFSAQDAYETWLKLDRDTNLILKLIHDRCISLHRKVGIVQDVSPNFR